MRYQLAMMTVIPVFKDINPLPGAQCQPMIVHRDGQLGLRQGCLDMGGHIVRSLGAMPVRAIPGSNAGKVILQIVAYIGISIFLNGQGG